MTWQEFYAEIREYYHIEDENTVTKVPFENIIEVNADTLVYKNGDGTVSHINLGDCVKNFAAALGEVPKNRSGEILRVVGGRCFLRSTATAFFEFFTEGHHTRFCMTLKRTPLRKFLLKIGWDVDVNAFSEFYALQKKLNSFGYSAIDLT
jgi:hypothetical protein